MRFADPATEFLSFVNGSSLVCPDIFPWDASFLTNIAVIDSHHQQLVRLVNDLNKASLFSLEKSTELYFSAVSELSRYAVEHFAAEERLMEEYGVDARHQKDHRGEHERFLTEAPVYFSVAESATPGSSEELFEYLANWLATHILHVDQCMARQISSIRAGANPQDAYDSEAKIQTLNVKPLINAVKALMLEVNNRRTEQYLINERMEEAVMLRTREFEEFNHHLRRLSTQDELTGLPNRRFALMSLKRVYTEHQRYKNCFAVILLDADGFKQVNDTFGHAIGDKVLNALAKRLQDSVRASDIVCRLGGDEFLIICPQTCRDGATEIGKKILDAKSPFINGEGQLCWSGAVSVGISIYSPDVNTDYQELMVEADKALYRAKRGGKDTMHIFDRSS